MRNYLYIWHEPRINRVMMSGVHFADFLPSLQGVGGLLLLRHEFSDAHFDRATGFDSVQAEQIEELVQENLYNYGDFCWADYGPNSNYDRLSDEAIAELAFFRHIARPLRSVPVPGLGNRFLCYAHDDGWYASVYYSNWILIEELLQRLLPNLLSEQEAGRTIESLAKTDVAFWISTNNIIECEKTNDIDRLQIKYLKPSPSNQAGG